MPVSHARGHRSNHGSVPFNYDPRAHVDCYLCSFELFSIFSLMFGKLGEARSRLYRSRCLQVDTRLKAADEVYKIYTYASFGEKNRSLCTAPNSKVQLNFVKRFPFLQFYFRDCTYCLQLLSKCHRC